MPSISCIRLNRLVCSLSDADLFSWALGKKITSEQVENCAHRRSGRPWAIIPEPLQELGGCVRVCVCVCVCARVFVCHAWHCTCPLPRHFVGTLHNNEDPVCICYTNVCMCPLCVHARCVLQVSTLTRGLSR